MRTLNARQVLIRHILFILVGTGCLLMAASAASGRLPARVAECAVAAVLDTVLSGAATGGASTRAESSPIVRRKCV